MQQLIEISQEICQQQIENRYLRECYTALKTLHESTADTIMAIDELFESQTRESMASISVQISRLQEKTCQLTSRVCRAQDACEKLCPTEIKYSARHQLEPILRMIEDQSNQKAHESRHSCETMP